MLHGDANAESERKQIEGLELHQPHGQQIDGVIGPPVVGMELHHVAEQRDAEEIEQVDQQHAEEGEAAHQIKHRVPL